MIKDKKTTIEARKKHAKQKSKEDLQKKKEDLALAKKKSEDAEKERLKKDKDDEKARKLSARQESEQRGETEEEPSRSSTLHIVVPDDSEANVTSSSVIQKPTSSKGPLSDRELLVQMSSLVQTLTTNFTRLETEVREKFQVSLQIMTYQ